VILKLAIGLSKIVLCHAFANVPPFLFQNANPLCHHRSAECHLTQPPPQHHQPSPLSPLRGLIGKGSYSQIPVAAKSSAMFGPVKKHHPTTTAMLPAYLSQSGIFSLSPVLFIHPLNAFCAIIPTGCNMKNIKAPLIGLVSPNVAYDAQACKAPLHAKATRTLKTIPRWLFLSHPTTRPANSPACSKA